MDIRKGLAGMITGQDSCNCSDGECRQEKEEENQKRIF